MNHFYIIPKELYEATDWVASSCCNVGPVQIYTGQHAGSYAVNTKLFESDPCFEKFRPILEPLPTSDLNGGQDLIAEEVYE